MSFHEQYEKTVQDWQALWKIKQNCTARIESKESSMSEIAFAFMQLRDTERVEKKLLTKLSELAAEHKAFN